MVTRSSMGSGLSGFSTSFSGVFLGHERPTLRQAKRWCCRAGAVVDREPARPPAVPGTCSTAGCASAVGADPPLLRVGAVAPVQHDGRAVASPLSEHVEARAARRGRCRRPVPTSVAGRHRRTRRVGGRRTRPEPVDSRHRPSGPTIEPGCTAAAVGGGVVRRRRRAAARSARAPAAAGRRSRGCSATGRRSAGPSLAAPADGGGVSSGSTTCGDICGSGGRSGVVPAVNWRATATTRTSTAAGTSTNHHRPRRRSARSRPDRAEQAGRLGPARRAARATGPGDVDPRAVGAVGLRGCGSVGRRRAATARRAAGSRRTVAVGSPLDLRRAEHRLREHVIQPLPASRPARSSRLECRLVRTPAAGPVPCCPAAPGAGSRPGSRRWARRR